jgi:autotransporter-associated beta strand protein
MAHGATGGADYINHKYNLRGGVLNVSGINNTSGVVPTGPTAAVGGNGNGFAPIFNFDGGTLRASQSDSDDPGVVNEGWNYLMSNLWHAYVEDGGAIIDTQDFTNSINQALEHDPTLGATPDGGLTKLGSGRLILLQPSTYTGDTTVTDGVLEVMQLYLDDASSVAIADGSMMDLNFQGIDVIEQLILSGVAQGPGIYDAVTDPDFFAGTGALQVAQIVPEPSTFLLAVLGLVGMLVLDRRRHRS